MIPVTDEPMEGVAFDVQDHTRRTGTIWIGTHGEMISLDLHRTEEPIRWMMRPHHGAETRQRWISVLHQRRRGRSTRGTPTELDLGGFALFQWNVGLGRPRTSPIIAMMSSSSMDALRGRLGNIGTCGKLEKPKEG
jgi:hypothetical protein